MSAVAITLNGERTEVEDGLSIRALLDNLGVVRERVVVEHNRRILRAPDLEAARVGEGDEVEIVSFVGGG